MNLEEAKRYAELKLAQGNKSDGCTLSPEICRKCCKMHDMLRRFRPESITKADADRLMRECFVKEGWPIAAWVYWAGVRILGIWFR